MEPNVEQELDTSQIFYWFETIPYDVRRILMANMNISSFLNFMQCSTQCHQESYQESAPILERCRFRLKLIQREASFTLELECETDSESGDVTRYKGILVFIEKSENSTEINIERYRRPVNNLSKRTLDYNGSQFGWKEDKNMNDLVLQYLTSYFNSFGKHLHTLEIHVDSDSDIATRISELFSDVKQFKKLLNIIIFDGLNINFDQFAQLKAKNMKFANLNLTKEEILMLFEHWKDGELNQNISQLEIRGEFDYDEEIEQYIERYMSPLHCQESASVIYDFSRLLFETKVVINCEKCTFYCNFKKYCH